MGRNFVPISLLLVVEMIRFIQARMIMTDKNMFSEEVGCVVQTSNLNEDLGSVEYLFSDKTGTLTLNQMVFKRLTLNGSVYGMFDHRHVLMLWLSR